MPTSNSRDSDVSAPPTTPLRDGVIEAVRFRDERARQPVAWSGTIPDLVGRCHLPRVEKKGSPAFSPVRYRDGATRGKRGVIEATALVLDFDHLSTEVAESVWKRLRELGWGFVAYSSFSHLASGPDDCCFRLVLPVTRPIVPREYDAAWDAAHSALGRYSDTNSRDISRIWFVASCPPERTDRAWLRVVDGAPFDVDRAVRNAGRSSKKGGRRCRRSSGGDTEEFGQGERNAGLTSLGGTLRRRGAKRDELLAFLHAANRDRCKPPLDDAEVEQIVESLLRYDPESPLLALNRTDAGNAERFRDHMGDGFRYCHPWGSWLSFDGVRWTRDASGEAMRSAIATLRATAAEAACVPDEKYRDRLLKHALDSESSARIAALLTIAQSLLPIAPEKLDGSTDLLNVTNGTVDLQTGDLRPHDSAHYLTRLAPVEFDPSSTCPLWEAFLERIMGGNQRLISFLQRAVGYSLTGHTTEQVLLLLYGTGANGKSTFLEILRLLLGDYATIADFTTFLKRDSEGARNDLARLVGTRFVSAVEAEAGKPLAEALVKQLTGGDTITARFLFKEFFDFKPQFKIWLAANHKPAIRGSDHGIWRRIRLVPFTVTIPDHEQDRQLPQKLAEELPGILAWAVRGCMAWRTEGLGIPEEVRAATDSYRDEMDLFGGFLEESCVAGADASITAKNLYAAYTSWCEANGEKVRSQKALAGSLRERGFENGRLAKGVRCWHGLRLRREDDPPMTEGDGWRMGGASQTNLLDITDHSDPACAGSDARHDPANDPHNASSSVTRHPSVTRHADDECEEGEL